MNIASVNRAQMLLKLTYALVPIIIGLDKIFTWMLVDWAKYSSPVIMGLLPISMTTLHFVMLTGIIEIVAGIFVWFYPRLGAYTIVAWMALVIVNLATMNQFYDIIARDGVIAVGALALAWLS
ncbi:MAG: hypothetical protein M1114_03605 [Candidatus Dependentiae bacterium]|nr:hypothetical protein [Candidatus Dependentiae bacterium]